MSTEQLIWLVIVIVVVVLALYGLRYFMANR